MQNFYFQGLAFIIGKEFYHIVISAVPSWMALSEKGWPVVKWRHVKTYIGNNALRRVADNVGGGH